MYTGLCFSEMVSNILFLGGSTLFRREYAQQSRMYDGVIRVCFSRTLPLSTLQIGCFSSIVAMKMNILLHFDFESAGRRK